MSYYVLTYADTFFRLIKENICDKTSVPSVSAISRLLRGRDEDEVKKSSKFLILVLIIGSVNPGFISLIFVIV